MKELHGIIPYLVSPLDENGTVKAEVFSRLCKDLLNEGVHGLCVLGSSGEFPYLSFEQKKELVRLTVEARGNNSAPVVAGVAGYSTAQAIKEARTFVEMGVDAIVIMLEQYFPLTIDQMADFYRTVAQAIPHTTCSIYSNPKFMHYEIPLKVFEKLVDVENIRYYKDARGVTGQLLSLTNKFGDRFQVFSASAHVPLFVSQLGGVGWMAGPACMIPRQCVRLYEFCQQKKWDEALVLQRQLWSANEVFAKYGLAGAVKAGLAYLGYPVGEPIAPNRGVSAEAKEEIIQVIDRIRRL